MGINFTLNQLNCLKALLGTNYKISIEQYSAMFKWFGHPSSVIQNALNFCNKEWFHGSITRDESERLLLASPNKFVVRMTLIETNPKIPPKDIMLHPFTLSFNIKGQIGHKRLLYDPENNKYKTDNRNLLYDSIFDLVVAESKELDIIPLGGSKYKKILDTTEIENDTAYSNGSPYVTRTEMTKKKKKKKA